MLALHSDGGGPKASQEMGKEEEERRKVLEAGVDAEWPVFSFAASTPSGKGLAL